MFSYGTVRNISLLNKFFHFAFHDYDNIDMYGVAIKAPWNSPNTNGIDISRGFTNITSTSSTIGTGDDCVSIGSGSTNISVLYVNCGPSHGIK
jgi:galacturan 1,4-alpha-galacturonidase